MAIESRDVRGACNLSDVELKARLELLSEEFFPFVRKREELPSSLALTFDDTLEMRERLDEFVAVERTCCSSIDWSVQSVSGGLRLEIEGIDPKSRTLAFVGPNADAAVAMKSDSGKRSSWPRWFRSMGLGSIGAILVCCALPLGVAAFVGATPMLLLDNGWVIGGVALGLGGLLWYWEGRREAGRGDGASASCCDC